MAFTQDDRRLLRSLKNCSASSNVALQQSIDNLNTTIGSQTDYEVIDSGWICNDDTSTWTRIITSYVDGVAQTPQTIDSGRSCEQPAPSNIEFEDTPICIEGVSGGILRSFIDTSDQSTVSREFIDKTGVIAEPANWEYGSCTLETRLTFTHRRTSGRNSYKAPYKSLSVTSFSEDVKINDQLIPKGMTVTVSTNDNEIITSDTIVTGSDYFTTLIEK